jgi:hypothetical protein
MEKINDFMPLFRIAIQPTRQLDELGMVQNALQIPIDDQRLTLCERKVAVCNRSTDLETCFGDTRICKFQGTRMVKVMLDDHS